MAGLSDKERAGCAKMLRLMEERDIKSLFETVTNRKIEVETTKGAMEAIITYSNDAAELLKRRKVQRDTIFKYLAKEGIAMPNNSDKSLLVKKTLEFWSSGKELDRQGPDIQSPDIKAELTVEQQGEQFCRWFFQLLNSQNPSLGQPPQDWGPQHFWMDAKLHLTSSAAMRQEEQLDGAELVHKRLLALVRDEQLFLNPNLGPHGHRVVSSAHGLVLVAAAGTVHRDDRCLGLFEQVFGLIRSPAEDTWKIKFIDLKVRGPGRDDGRQGASPTPTCDLVALQRQFT